jgi:hypothetical protein
MPLLSLLACVRPPPVADDPGPASPPPEPTVQQRTEARLASTAGGRLLQEAIDGHGGLEPWLQSGSLTFTFDYAPIGAPEKRRYTRNQVNLRSRHAVQEELGPGADARLGWDGTEAWITPGPDAFPSSARFWATTPFYFVGLPWVLADEGTVHTVLEDTVVPLTGEERPLPTVKVTYEPGTGDAPDDFYVLHLHPDTHQILAVRYIVSFPDYFPDGGHSPEKILRWSGHTTVDGLVFATHYDSHVWNDGTPGERTTTVAIDDLALGPPLPDASFRRPSP